MNTTLHVTYASSRRSPAWRRQTLTLLLALLGTLAFSAGAAEAAPETVTGPNGLSMTVDDSTPVPGQTVTIDFTYTSQPGETSGSSLGFGDDNDSDPIQVSHNLSVLSLDSCGGDFSNCRYDFTELDAFEADIPASPANTVITGTADFVIDPIIEPGDNIRFSGFHHGNTGTTHTGQLRLTIAAPPSAADLGVDLTASSSLLLTNRVNYDAAVTNNGPDATTSATITTQLPSQSTSIASTTCTFSSTTHQVSCPIDSVANGATTHATFTAFYGFLTIGLPLHAQATRTASAPSDPSPSNDSDGADCTALTALLIAC